MSCDRGTFAGLSITLFTLYRSLVLVLLFHKICFHFSPWVSYPFPDALSWLGRGSLDDRATAVV